MIEDMQLRNRTPRTQRSYVHYVAEYARYFNVSPEKLDAEAIRQYLLYALNERKLSPESVNTCVSALKFLDLNTLEMPWTEEYSPAPNVRTSFPSSSAGKRCCCFSATSPA